MNSTDQIEQIVREVIRRLADHSSVGPARSNGQPVSSRVSGNGVTAKTTSSDSEANNSAATARVATRLVSLQTLKEPLQDRQVRQLEVPVGAVLTPSVRDLLRERRIAVRYVGSTRTEGTPLLVASTLEQEPAAQWAKRLESLQSTQVVTTGEPLEIIDQLTNALQHESGRAVVFSGQPMAVSMHANRNQHLRAAWCWDAETLQRAVREIQINVLVIDPVAKGAWSIHRMLETWLGMERSSSHS